MKVTVLMAVYNAHTFLREALDSLLGQTMADWEAICVDDASTDDSMRILDEYAARDTRFQVVHLDHNQGQAHARNVGLRHAQGDCVAFLDSDDVLSPDALECLVGAFETHGKADCVLFRLVYFHRRLSDGTSYPMKDFDSMTGPEAFEASLTWRIHGVYAVRRSIHERYPYDETSRAYSDDNTTRLHYLMSREVRLCEGTYYYRQHAASVTHAVGMRRFDYLDANASMKRQMQELHVGEGLMDVYENARWLNVIDVCWFYHLHGKELPVEQRAHGLDRIRRAWQSIETERLKPSLKRKFGYMPVKGHWHLFCMQERVYFSLRQLLGRILPGRISQG